MKTKKKKDRLKNRTDEIFGEIMTGLSEAVRYAGGKADETLFKAHIPDEIDVAAVRKKTGLSQTKFANTYGFSAAAIRDYEQKRRTPDSAVRAYLTVIAARADEVRVIVYAIIARKKSGGKIEVVSGRRRYDRAKKLGYEPHIVRKIDKDTVEVEMRPPH